MPDRSLDLLFLTPQIPYPPTDGGRIAVFEPIRHLAQRGHRITLLSLGVGATEDWSVLKQYCYPEVIEHDTANHLLPGILNLFSKIPYTISKYNSREMALRMRHLLASASFDLVQIEHLHMGHYLPVAKEYDVPVLLRQQNVESIIADRFRQKVRGVYRLYVKAQLGKLQRFEARACAEADACLTITDADANRLKRMNSHINTIVIPAGVDTAYYSPQSDPKDVHGIVFVGSMDWLPNVDAVLWFCDEILARIRQQVPDVRFYVVGKNPPNAIRRLSAKREVVVTGLVHDVREYVAKAGIFAVPLRIGSGMRLKILEAMAMGKAIVSTTIGAEGIRVVNGRDILLADKAEDFAEASVRLLRNATLRHYVGSNGRDLVERYYSWERIIDLTELVYQDIVQQKCRRLAAGNSTQ